MYREVYVDFNQNTVDLWDVTDKAATALLSSTGYSDSSYTHSGWSTTDQRHIFVHDETEEINRGMFTPTYTMNVDDLGNPFEVENFDTFLEPAGSSAGTDGAWGV